MAERELALDSTLSGGDKWLIRDVTRSGVPCESAGGKEQGWEVSAVRNTVEDHNLVQIGDFTDGEGALNDAQGRHGAPYAGTPAGSSLCRNPPG